MGMSGHSSQGGRKYLLKFVLLRDHAPASEASKWARWIFQLLDEAARGAHVLARNVAGVVLRTDDIGAVACVPASDEPPANTPRPGNNAGSKTGVKTLARSLYVGKVVEEKDRVDQRRRRYDGNVPWEVEAPSGPPERSASLSGTSVSRVKQRPDRNRRVTFTLRVAQAAV